MDRLLPWYTVGTTKFFNRYNFMVMAKNGATLSFYVAIVVGTIKLVLSV